MSTTQEEVQKLQLELHERQVWFSFFVTHRGYNNFASRQILDQWLTDNVMVLSPENLDLALEATEHLLAYKDPFDRPPAPIREVEAPVVVENPNAIPAATTREVILAMDRTAFKSLLKKYGQEAVENRVNNLEAQ